MGKSMANPRTPKLNNQPNLTGNVFNKCMIKIKSIEKATNLIISILAPQCLEIIEIHKL